MTTQLTFDGTHTPAPAQCGCELRGSSAVLLCPLHAAASDLMAACENTAASLTICLMPRLDNNVATNEQIIAIALDGLRVVIAKVKAAQ